MRTRLENTGKLDRLPLRGRVYPKDIIFGRIKSNGISLGPAGVVHKQHRRDSFYPVYFTDKLKSANCLVRLFKTL